MLTMAGRGQSQRDDVTAQLTKSVQQEAWPEVVELLQQHRYNQRQRDWAVTQAVGKAGEAVVDSLIPHCSPGQLGPVLKELVVRHLWKSVGVVLQRRDLSVALQTRAVEESSKVCTTEGFVRHILPHCTDSQLDSVLTQVVTRGMWDALGELLQRRVSDTKRRWAVVECTQRLDSTNDWLVQYVLPHIADDQVNSVLNDFVTRGVWKGVGKLLERGVSERQRRRAVDTISRSREIKEEELLQHVLPHCADDQLDSVLWTLLRLGRWKAVNIVLYRVVSEEQHRLALLKYAADSRNDVSMGSVLRHCGEEHHHSVLAHLVTRNQWGRVGFMIQALTSERRAGQENESSKRGVVPPGYITLLPDLAQHGKFNFVLDILHLVVWNTLWAWVKQDNSGAINDSTLWTVLEHCRIHVSHGVHLFKAMKEYTAGDVGELAKLLCLKEDLCKLLYTSVLRQVCVVLCSEDTAFKRSTDHMGSGVIELYSKINAYLRTNSPSHAHDIVDHFSNPDNEITTDVIELSSSSSGSVQPFFHFVGHLRLYHSDRKAENDDNILLTMFTVLPFFPELQSVALRSMLRHKRWDVISQACVTHVWEQEKRHLLQAAVNQKQWDVVRKWADHTLYDDQRVWALDRALKDEQWGVAMLLADHGLTDIELMRVRYRLAKYAGWDVVLQMFERGCDVAEVAERLRRMKENKRITDSVKKDIIRRHQQVLKLERELQSKTSKAVKNACLTCDWTFVLFFLIRSPRKKYMHMALKAALKREAWHVVMQLVRFGLDATTRYSLFSQMIRQQQWDVCRVLLEQGVSVELCLGALPELMRRNQWALVARVMEYEVSNACRQEVMQRALERREGSVVWLCIRSLPTKLTLEEREGLFQRALTCELWQFMKPLVEEKDSTGIQHRDIALLEAIEQHQWDVVDHCQLHHADINMKDEKGHSPLQRMAMKQDWEAVDELVVRDGDPDRLDKEGQAVLHRAIEAEQWDTVTLLVLYQADIHVQGNVRQSTRTDIPLNLLIDAQQGKIIGHSLIWCPGQHKGINDKGETALHAACISGCWDSIYYLVARGVDPLALTHKGDSVLKYAVLGQDCPEKTVAQCIRLGFSTHQPHLTNFAMDVFLLSLKCSKGVWLPEKISSTVLCSVLCGLPVVTRMLYESGSCSHRELFWLYRSLKALVDPCTLVGRQLQERLHQRDAECTELAERVELALPYLKVIASTPRRLESTCRLVISHCLDVRGKRHKDVVLLELTKATRDLVLFSDLTEPFLGKP